MIATCPRCSTRIDAAVQGLCPRCLLDLALADPGPVLESPFRVVTLLGRGAHGTTYLAEQDDEPRYVALKVLDTSGAADPRGRLASIRSALLACRHPSIVRIVDVTLDPVPSVAAAYVHGRRVSAAAGDPVSGFLDVANALAYLHERGLVHRNIRSSNVLATAPDSPGRPPRWCVIDLATASRLASASDAATDLASFGALVHEVLGPREEGTSARCAAIRAIANRALHAGRGEGYTAASDLLRDLAAL